MSKNIIIIIGGGQMGFSIASGLKQRQEPADLHVQVIEPNPEYREQMLMALGSELSISENIENADIEEADLVILATPISQFGDVTDQIATRLKDGAIITDVGSAKYTSVMRINESLDQSGRNHSDVFYVPSHPGVGKAGQGPLTGDPDMYEGHPVFVVPPGTEASSEKHAAFQEVKSFWSELGAKTAEIDVFSHDRFFGATSHFQHVAVFALTELGRESEQNNLSTGYYNARTWMRNTTRISQANPDMWVPVFQENKTALLEAAEGFSQKVDIIKRSLTDSDTPLELKEVLMQAHNYRISMRDDEPREGVVAELFDWAEFYDIELTDLPEAKNVSSLFNNKSGADFMRGTLLPTALAAALTLNVQEIDSAKVKGINIAENANPSFLDGSAPMLSDPDYLADLLFYNRDTFLPVLEAYMTKFDMVVEAIENKDDLKIRSLIEDVSDIRSAMPEPRKYLDVTTGMEVVRERYLVRSGLDQAVTEDENLSHG